MNVLLVTDYFYPQSSGGTEKYVYELAKGLKDANIDVIILTVTKTLGSYDYDGFKVHTIPENTDVRKEVVAGLIPADNLQYFIDKIKQLQPDAIHFHTLTTSLSTFHYQAAKQLSSKIIFTSHIPGNTCLRGDLMLYGEKICDGKVRLNTCQSCYLNARGIPRVVSPLIAITMRSLKQPRILSQASAIKKQQLEIMKMACNAVVTMSNWQQDVFLINGFTPEQLALSRHTFKQVDDYSKPQKTDITVIGYAGRVSPEKGLHILIEAFEHLDNNKFQLSIAAIKSTGQNEYFEKLIAKTRDFPNVKWNFDYNINTIDSFYKLLNVLCIPSVCNETGPYVMFESIARHIPVVASNLGGMREWAGLNYPVITYPYNNAKALAGLLNNLSININPGFTYPPQRTQAQLADEMIAVYTK